jgi:hypothetical protein
MKAEFTALVQQLIAEQGRDALFNAAKCKAFLLNNPGASVNERRLLQQVVDAGITGGIANASNVAAYKAQAVQKLQSDYYLAPNVAKGVVDVLVQLIQTPTAVARTAHQPPAQQAPAQQPVYQAPPWQPAYQAPPPQYAQPVSSAPNDVKLRHGFTSFWLWVNCIGNILGAAGFVFVCLNGLETSGFQFFALLGVFLITASAFHSIIKWEKYGFYTLVVVMIAATIFNPFELFEIDRLGCFISLAISNAILYGVLHFRNAYNAKTTWEQLS